MIDSNGFGGGGALTSTVGGAAVEAALTTVELPVDDELVLVAISTLLAGDLLASTTISTFLVVCELEEGFTVVLAATGLELGAPDDSLGRILWASDDEVALLAEGLGDGVGSLFNPRVSFTLDGRSSFTAECMGAGFEVVLDPPLVVFTFTLVDSSEAADFLVVLESSRNTTTVLGSFRRLLTFVGVLVVDAWLRASFSEDEELPVAGLCVVDGLKSMTFISEFFDTAELALLSPSNTLLTTSLMIDISSSLSWSPSETEPSVVAFLEWL